MNASTHAHNSCTALPLFKVTIVFCLLQVSHAFNIVYNSGLNTYALYLDCAGGITSQRAMMHLFRNFRKHWEANKVSLVRSNHAVFQSTLINLIEQRVNVLLIVQLVGSTPNVQGVPPCINSTAQMNWLNRGDVRKALHIPDVLPPWDICR